MSSTTFALTIETPALAAASSWGAFEALAVAMSKQLPAQALAQALFDAQEALIDSVCGPKWAPVRGVSAPFACPKCHADSDFARKGRRSRPRVLHTAAGRVEIVLWHVGCRACGRSFAPLLVMLGLSGQRRTDRLMVDLAELGTQTSFARAGRIDDQLAGPAPPPGRPIRRWPTSRRSWRPRVSSGRLTGARTWSCSTARVCAPGRVSMAPARTSRSV